MVCLFFVVVLRFYLDKTYRPDPRQIIYKRHKDKLKTDKYVVGCGEVESVLILQ